MNHRDYPERPSPQDTLISVVLPVYNEAGVLPELLDRVANALSDTGADYEILFVDDGSRDASPQILDALAAGDDRVRVVHFSRNFGHQPAVQAGLAHSRGDAVVLMDSDMQDAPDAIGRFVEEWRDGYDVVYALRVHRKEGRLKRFLFAAFHRLMSRMASIPLPADAGNFGLIDRRVARQIASLGEHDRYFPGLRSWVGFRQKGIEVERNARYDDSPRVSLLGLIRLAKAAVFSFSSFPLTIFYLISGLAMLLFLGLSCYSLYSKLVVHQAIPGWTSHILVSSLFGALNALGIAILGEYMVRIYDQVRGRPLYVIDRTVNMEQQQRHEQGMEDPNEQHYAELMEEAARLLESGTLPTNSQSRTGIPDDVAEPIVLPMVEDSFRPTR